MIIYVFTLFQAIFGQVPIQDFKYFNNGIAESITNFIRDKNVMVFLFLSL